MLCNGRLPCRNRCAGPLVTGICLALVTPLFGRAGGSEPLPGGGGEAESRPIPPRSSFSRRASGRFWPTRCQGCHGPAKQKGGLRLDARAALIAGGSTGPAVVPGNPKESLLVDAINYGETYQMPPKSKLPDRRDRHPDRMGQARRSVGCRDASRRGGSGRRQAGREIRPTLDRKNSRNGPDTGAFSRSGESRPPP